MDTYLRQFIRICFITIVVGLGVLFPLHRELFKQAQHHILPAQKIDPPYQRMVNIENQDLQFVESSQKSSNMNVESHILLREKISSIWDSVEKHSNYKEEKDSSTRSLGEQILSRIKEQDQSDEEHDLLLDEQSVIEIDKKENRMITNVPTTVFIASTLKKQTTVLYRNKKIENINGKFGRLLPPTSVKLESNKYSEITKRIVQTSSSNPVDSETHPAADISSVIPMPNQKPTRSVQKPVYSLGTRPSPTRIMDPETQQHTENVGEFVLSSPAPSINESIINSQVTTTPIFSDAIEKTVKYRGKVLIATLARSGSSFVGDLFNNHKDVLYFFEPLHSAYILQRRYRPSAFDDDVSHNEEVSEYFHGLLNCELHSKHGDFIKYFSKFNDRYRAKALTRPPFCFQDRPVDCKAEPIVPKLYNKECKERFSHVVIKELQPRLPLSIEGLNQVIPDRPKIIQLVRDPRAIFLSFMKAGFFKSHKGNQSLIRETVRDHCRILKSNTEYGLKYLAPIGLYKVFRYEDICMNFQNQTREILSFVNLPLYPEYEQYLDQVQQVKNVSQKERKRTYSTKRELTVQVSGWRTTIHISFSAFVERQCADVMRFLGYKVIGTNYELLKNTNIPLY